VTQDGDHVVDEDTEDVKNQGSEKDLVQDSIAARRPEEIPISPHSSLQI